jgi:hypothetical protein
MVALSIVFGHIKAENILWTKLDAEAALLALLL